MMTLAEGNGMGSSCKYCYISGACANKHVDSIQCVGEDKCQFSGLNVMTLRKHEREPDSHRPDTRWLGLYCEVHRKFHCDCRGGLSPPGSGPYYPRPGRGPGPLGVEEEG